MTSTKRADLTLWGITEECSVIVHAAFDFLKGGETIFGLCGEWESLPNMQDDHIAALIALLRSDEPIPSVIRLALADALDVNADSPVSLKAVTHKRAKASTKLSRVKKSKSLLAALDALKVEGMTPQDALAKAAKSCAVNEGDASRMLADARSGQAMAKMVGEAMESGKSVREIFDMIAQFRVSPPKRGPKKAAAD